MQFRKYTKEDLINAVKISYNMRQVLTILGVKAAGGNYDVLRKYIKELNLDTSHFTGQSWSKGKILIPKRNIQEYLSNEFSTSSHRLRLRLLKEELFPYQCNCCLLKEWQGKPIPLELHHKDGNNKNNNLSNLELLCPNCHSQTENFRGKNKVSS